MPKITTAALTGAALDWAVARCEGVEVRKYPASQSLFFGKGFDKYSPSTSWSQGGPIIDRGRIGLWANFAEMWGASNNHRAAVGPTPLIAAMRCYVMFKLGDEVDVPKEISDEQRPSPRR